MGDLGADIELGVDDNPFSRQEIYDLNPVCSKLIDEQVSPGAARLVLTALSELRLTGFEMLKAAPVKLRGRTCGSDTWHP